MDVLYGAAGNVAGSASTLSTIGAIAAIKDKAHLKNNFERLERRRRIAYEILGSVPGVAMKMSESGILSWLTISKLGTAEQVAERIMTDARIMINRGTPYGSQGEGHIRIVSGCFNKDEDAEKRFQRIRTVLAAMAKR
jgi:aspartate/methionine/tyrosine aminotransferase